MVTEHFSFKMYSHLRCLEDTEFGPTWLKCLFLFYIYLFKDLIKTFVLLTFWKNLLQNIVLCLFFEKFVCQIRIVKTESPWKYFQSSQDFSKNQVKFWALVLGSFLCFLFFFYPLLFLFFSFSTRFFFTFGWYLNCVGQFSLEYEIFFINLKCLICSSTYPLV